MTNEDPKQYGQLNINWAKMAGDSKLKAMSTFECDSPSPSNTVREQTGFAKPDSTRCYVTVYRPLTPSTIAASDTVPVETSLERPIEATEMSGQLSPASADFMEVAKRQRVASSPGSSNAADGESKIPNTPRERHSRLLLSTPELGKQPIACNSGETLSLATRTKLINHLGPDAIGDVESSRWLTIANPFNYPWEFLAPRGEFTTPPQICIPQFINSPETLEFMGFEPSKAEFIFEAYCGWSAPSNNGPSLDLLWCAMQYVATMEEEANKEGCFDQRMIKERIGFHWGLTLFYIDTGVPTPTEDYFYEPEGRIINHIILRICRRYDFLVALDNGINNTGMMAWSVVAVPRTLMFASPESDVICPGVGEVDQAGMDFAGNLSTEGY